MLSTWSTTWSQPASCAWMSTRALKRHHCLHLLSWTTSSYNHGVKMICRPMQSRKSSRPCSLSSNNCNNRWARQSTRTTLLINNVAASSTPAGPSQRDHRLHHLRRQPSRLVSAGKASHNRWTMPTSRPMLQHNHPRVSAFLS